MSNSNFARRTTAKISFLGADITESILPYLLSLTYTDNEEDETDDLQIKLQDKDSIWLTEWLNEAIQSAASSLPSESSAASGTTTYTVNAKSGLNVRTGPGTSYSKLGALVYGANVNVTGQSGEWSVIRYNGKDAYVSTQYLTAAVNGNSYPTVQYGSKNDTVRFMQECLLQLGCKLPVYGVDGNFKSETRTAVISFQTDHNLKADGICGPETWAVILAMLNGSSSEQRKGLTIQAVIVRENWNSDGKDKILDCGQFELDSIDASGSPSVITIKATSLPYNSQIRQTKKTKAWESYYLSGIASEMAKLNGMSCLYLSEYDPHYDRIEQYCTSDIGFLSELCHNAGISLKVTNNILVLFDQASFESTESIRIIRRGDGSYSKWKLNTGKSDTQYSSCRVSYTTPSGKCIEAVAKVDDYKEDSTKNQQLEIRAKVSSYAEALSLAEKNLRLHNKFSKTVSFTMPGDPDLVAGITITLADWGAFDGKYIISQAKHSISNSGYTVQISARCVLEGY